MLNFKVRVQQKWFWITLVPLLFLLAKQIFEIIEILQTATVIGLFEGELQALVIAMIGTLFAILALVGFPVDLTTTGYGDSARALTYEEPAINASEQGIADYRAYTNGTLFAESEEE